jgi:hypothetical protein
MIILVDAEKSFDKTQHLFMIQALKKLEIEGAYFHILKAIYDKPRANIHTNWGEPETISIKVRNKTDVHCPCYH